MKPTMRCLIPVVLIALTAAIPLAGHAQNPLVVQEEAAPPTVDPDSTAAMIGDWEISNADHDQTCAVTFRDAPGPAGGMKLDFDRAACAAKFPLLKEAAAWKMADDTVKITDAKGRLLYEFTEVEDGMYESLREGQPLTFLQSAAAAADIVRNVSQMTGDWGVVRGSGDPVCIITLMNAPAANVGDLQLQVKPGCDKGIAAFGFAAWQMDKNELVLKSTANRIWRFEENNGIWQRVPEGVDAILLVKQ
jgi:hypothetical protein